MKKYLPILILISFTLTSLFGFVPNILASSPAPSPSLSGAPAAVTWVPDSEITFIGKMATRASDLLNWVIAHHQWSFVKPGEPNPFDAIWFLIRDNVYKVLALFILAAAFVIIITRGTSLTAKRFVPRLILVAVLIFMSFSLVSILYTIGDYIQDFFFKRPDGRIISSEDLLYISFDYPSFTTGYRVDNPSYNESIFTSSLLVKLTAATYYAMFVVLIVRKIILWFFIVLSPIFPLLLLFGPLRNSAKIWAGELFRWLLYGPLFAVLLAGLVAMWRVAIPLDLNLPCDNPDTNQRYPTAISILLGGPCSNPALDNSLNSPDTFIQYVVALLMLWMVIIVPFLLLKIFLDYFNNFSFTESNIVKFLAQTNLPLLQRYRGGGGGGGGPGGNGGPPHSDSSAGLAKALPTEAGWQNFKYNPQEFNQTMEQSMAENIAQNTQTTNQILESQQQQNIAQNVATEAATNIAQNQINQSALNSAAANSFGEAFSSSVNQIFNQASNTNSSNMATANLQVGDLQARQASAEILNLTNLNIPTMRDIGRFESSQLSNSSFSHTQQEASRISETLNRISGVSQISSPSEIARFSQIRERLVQETQKGNPVASSILSASAALSASMPASSAATFHAASAAGAGGNLAGNVSGNLAGNLSGKTSTDLSSIISGSVKGGAGNMTSNVSGVGGGAGRLGSSSTQISNQSSRVSSSPDLVAATSVIPGVGVFPEMNRVQQVSLDDYEEVKKIWQENYRKADPPPTPDGKNQTRKQWLLLDIKKIPQAIDLLLSDDPEKIAEGKRMVSTILPFLLLGGFSKAEIIAYLKAKLEAAKSVLKEVLEVETQEDTLLDLEKKKTEQPKSMETAAEIPEPNTPTGNKPTTKDDKKGVQ